MSNEVQTSGGVRAPANAPAGNAPQSFVVPPVDVFENENAITVLADLPGVPRDQLNLRVDGDTLLIEATASAASTPPDMELVYGELQCPAYRRQFTLRRSWPLAAAKDDRIEARFHDCAHCCIKQGMEFRFGF